MILLLALLFALPDAGIASGVPNYTEHWFTQPVDHFNILSNDTFKQRYLMTGILTPKFDVLPSFHTFVDTCIVLYMCDNCTLILPWPATNLIGPWPAA